MGHVRPLDGVDRVGGQAGAVDAEGEKVESHGDLPLFQLGGHVQGSQAGNDLVGGGMEEEGGRGFLIQVEREVVFRVEVGVSGAQEVFSGGGVSGGVLEADHGVAEDHGVDPGGEGVGIIPGGGVHPLDDGGAQAPGQMSPRGESQGSDMAGIQAEFPGPGPEEFHGPGGILLGGGPASVFPAPVLQDEGVVAQRDELLGHVAAFVAVADVGVSPAGDD